MPSLQRRPSGGCAFSEKGKNARRGDCAAALDASRRDFGTCRYDILARALPSRIVLAQALGREGRAEESATAVAELYSIATRLCIKLGEDGLAAVPPTAL